ncbi:DUF2797 domain-containing protein [Halorussus sp. MSC15.2]|uniref:DUF2797 domain-containing protein n=1 Tax=Halorussus sp. MSC15.2 TaxID=2283638 RepID=UPI0013D6AC60|nr:DUF2797 domain-containing protein [Halorussus sp. MSC15.2]NEU57276.1 DUF2797 domain-containing protein [Halorussus sp. MSC15.2]
MQIVGYETERDGESPGLLVADDREVRRESLESGESLGYSLGERRCAGTLDGTTHFDCENDDAPHCDRHTSTWVCARCTGTCLKDEMDCYDDHAVYLAAFAPATFKVGVTKEWRLRTRLREQGADRAAHLRTVENGRVAREIESRIAEEFTDRVRVPAKISGLHREVDAEAWDSTLAEFDSIERYDFDYGFELDAAPVAETLATGEIVGVQGRVLVLERGGTTYAVDMRDLVGYEIHDEESERELQSSLAAF